MAVSVITTQVGILHNAEIKLPTISDIFANSRSKLAEVIQEGRALFSRITIPRVSVTPEQSTQENVVTSAASRVFGTPVANSGASLTGEATSNLLSNVSPDVLNSLDTEDLLALNNVLDSIDALPSSSISGLQGVLSVFNNPSTGAVPDVVITIPNPEAAGIANSWDALISAPKQTFTLGQYVESLAREADSVSSIAETVEEVASGFDVSGLVLGAIGLAGLVYAIASNVLIKGIVSDDTKTLDQYVYPAITIVKTYRLIPTWENVLKFAKARDNSDQGIKFAPTDIKNSLTDQALQFGIIRHTQMLQSISLIKSQINTAGIAGNSPWVSMIFPTEAASLRSQYEGLSKSLEGLAEKLDDITKTIPSWPKYKTSGLISYTGPLDDWLNKVHEIEQLFGVILGAAFISGNVGSTLTARTVNYIGTIVGTDAAGVVGSNAKVTSPVSLYNPWTRTDLDRLTGGIVNKIPVFNLNSLLNPALSLDTTKTVTRTVTKTITRTEPAPKKFKKPKLKLKKKSPSKNTPIIIEEIYTDPVINGVSYIRFIFDTPSLQKSNSKGTIIVALNTGRVIQFKHRPRGLFSYVTTRPHSLPKLKGELTKQITSSLARKAITDELKQRSRFDYY